MQIYRIINKFNGKAYVGQTTKTAEIRWRQHLVTNKSNNCRALKAAIAKYSKDNFTIEVLSICGSREQLNDAESYFIDYYQTFGPGGYNLTSGGDSCVVAKETVERRLKCRAGKKPVFSADMREKLSKLLSERRKGSPAWNSGSKGLQTAWNKGLKATPEARANMSKAKMGNAHRKGTGKI